MGNQETRLEIKEYFKNLKSDPDEDTVVIDTVIEETDGESETKEDSDEL